MLLLLVTDIPLQKIFFMMLTIAFLNVASLSLIKQKCFSIFNNLKCKTLFPRRSWRIPVCVDCLPNLAILSGFANKFKEKQGTFLF